jgi:hypothetical protein
MRTILSGRSTGRDGLIVAEAVATVLAYQAFRPMPKAAEGRDNHWHEVTSLFDLATRSDPALLGMFYVEAAARLRSA